MKDLYICTGQYHLFCVLLLKQIDNKDREGDLLICDCFERARAFYEIIRRECSLIGKRKLFDNVLILERQQYKDRIPEALNKKTDKILRFISNHLISDKNTFSGLLDSAYERIFIAGPVLPLIEYCLFSNKKNGSEICIIDDGMGARLQTYDPTFKKRFFDLNKSVEFGKHLKCKYFFSPERVCDVYPYIPVIRQCKPKKSDVEAKGVDYDEVKRTMNRVFEYSALNDPMQESDIVYFAAGFDLYNHLKKYSTTECEIINSIGEKYDHVGVKRHPDSKEAYSSRLNNVDTSCMPEILFLNNNIEEKLLISSGSAAIFNSSFIYDKNPYIILTYKMFGKDDDLAKDLFWCSGQELEEKINITLKSGYKDPTKIYCPESTEELFKSIDEYKQRTKKI